MLNFIVEKGVKAPEKDDIGVREPRRMACAVPLFIVFCSYSGLFYFAGVSVSNRIPSVLGPQ